MITKHLKNGHSKYIKPNTKELRLATCIAMLNTNDAAKPTPINQIISTF